jgi:hypothetical protein
MFEMLEEVRGVDQFAAVVVERQRAGAQVVEDEPGLRQALGWKCRSRAVQVEIEIDPAVLQVIAAAEMEQQPLPTPERRELRGGRGGRPCQPDLVEQVAERSFDRLGLRPKEGAGDVTQRRQGRAQGGASRHPTSPRFRCGTAYAATLCSR